MNDDDLDDLIHRADLDGLVRMIDDRCAGRDFSGVLRVRDEARRAVATGRQLWPAATLAEYRVALLAPSELVAQVLTDTDDLSGRFALGPLAEVAAQHHPWSELGPLLGRGPRASFVAHERVVRGEALSADEGLAPVLELPTELQPWEPIYAVATYGDSEARFPPPDLAELASAGREVFPAGGAEPLDDDVELAVQQLVEPWTTASNGQVDVVCVEGDVADALGALGVRRARVAPLHAADALAWIAWAGASGGAHGRRRGAATGRFGAWWVLGALGDLLDEWPVGPDRLGSLANDLRWYRWDAFEPELGWILQLAIEDPDDRVAWAFACRDAA